MARPRYSGVLAEDKLAGMESLHEANMDTTDEHDAEHRREEDSDAIVTRMAEAGKQKHLPAATRSEQLSEEDDGEAGEHADETGSHGFHPARLPPSPSAALLHSSSSLSPYARLVAFSRLRLNRYYVVLLVALLAISCSGTLLRELPDTPPLLKGQPTA